MATPTIIRHWTDGRIVALVMTITTPHGMSAHFQTYTAHDNTRTGYQGGAVCATEEGAINLFNNFIDNVAKGDIKNGNT